MDPAPLKNKKHSSLSPRIDVGYFYEDAVKSAVEWFGTWDLATKEYPHKETCLRCKKKVAIWYEKNGSILCDDCLIEVAFEDVKQ